MKEAIDVALSTYAIAAAISLLAAGLIAFLTKALGLLEKRRR